MKVYTTQDHDEPDVVVVSAIYSNEHDGLTLRLHRDGSGAFELAYCADNGDRIAVAGNRNGTFIVRKIDPVDPAFDETLYEPSPPPDHEAEDE